MCVVPGQHWFQLTRGRRERRGEQQQKRIGERGEGDRGTKSSTQQLHNTPLVFILCRTCNRALTSWGTNSNVLGWPGWANWKKLSVCLLSIRFEAGGSGRGDDLGPELVAPLLNNTAWLPVNGLIHERPPLSRQSGLWESFTGGII